MTKYTLVGQNGNAVNLMDYTSNALKREGLGHLVKEMHKKAMSGDYYNLVAVCDEYVQKANEKAVENGWFDTEDDYE